MAYWSDDYALVIEQRRLDAAQEDARRKIEARRKAEAEKAEAEDLGMGERGDGFGEIWESDMCLRDSIRAKLELDAHSHPSASPRSSERI